MMPVIKAGITGIMKFWIGSDRKYDCSKAGSGPQPIPELEPGTDDVEKKQSVKNNRDRFPVAGFPRDLSVVRLQKRK